MQWLFDQYNLTKLIKDLENLINLRQENKINGNRIFELFNSTFKLAKSC